MLRRESLGYNQGATAQQICDKLDKILRKAVDELTPTEERKIRINGTIPSHIQIKKRKLRNLNKRAKWMESLDLMRKCWKMEKEIKIKKELHKSRKTKNKEGG